jgi:membrane-bound lytic murein transglycosylase B
MRGLKEDLQVKQDDLEEKKSDLEHLRKLQEMEKRTLDVNKNEKNQILKITKGEESKFQELVKKTQLDLDRLRTQIVYLQQNGVSVEDAVKYGELAAIAAGIRPAFLLAILEIESGMGKNVGTGNWMDDMYSCYIRLGKPKRAEDEKTAFMAIVGKLGLDPNTVKVSREPNYGCGGALGPAQFIPTTWLAYEADVIRLTGHQPPNPWNIEDAFTASAIKLARAGATSKDKKGESGAARAYIGGKTTCSSSACNYYSNAVLRKAAEIEQNL